MRTNGNLSGTALSGRIEQLIDILPLSKSYKIAARVVIGIFPAIAGSLLAPFISPVFVAASLFLIFYVFMPAQQDLFECGPEARWIICFFIHLTFVLWAAALAWTDNPEQIGRSVGAMVLPVASAIWPMYMSAKKYEKKKRAIKFETAYFIASSPVILQQLFIIRSLINV